MPDKNIIEQFLYVLQSFQQISAFQKSSSLNIFKHLHENFSCIAKAATLIETIEGATNICWTIISLSTDDTRKNMSAIIVVINILNNRRNK